MGKSKSIVTNNEEPPKKRGRQHGAKTYNQQTLYKLVEQYKPRNMVLWGTVAEEYRVQCGELKSRDPSALKKHFIHKMCYGKKPTESSGVDDFSPKCQTLNRALFSIEEANTFEEKERIRQERADDRRREDQRFMMMLLLKPQYLLSLLQLRTVKVPVNMSSMVKIPSNKSLFVLLQACRTFLHPFLFRTI